MIRVWTDPHNDSVLISLYNDANAPHLIHIPGIADAISQIEVVLETLRNSRPLEDIDVTQMVEDVNHEFSRLSGGEGSLLRMKFLRSTRNYQIYKDCGYEDDSGALEPPLSTIRIRKSQLPDIAPEFLSIHLRPSTPMNPDDYRGRA